MDNLKKLREKKKDSKMHPLEMKAKMDVVKHLQDMAHDAMGSKLKGIHKVTVASDSPEGLEHGLDKAKDVLGQGDDESEEMYAEGGMPETHPMNALHQSDEHDPIKDMEEAEDDSHDDHENFIHSENEENDEDGVEEYQDADTDHLLEMDEAKKHARDEHEEGSEDAPYAMGGEVMPNYDHMDEAMINRHLKHLLAVKKMKGMA